MDKVNQKMRAKFRGVLVGLRQSVTAPPKGAELEVEETLRSEHFKVGKIVRHGFPYQPTAMAYDPVQHLLAIGTKTGSLRIFGRPGVDCHVKHEGDVAVIQLMFQVNNGALISACSDDHLHLWTLRQKKPEIVHSIKFKRERITCCHLPFQSKWLYVGTERGNVHIVNIESFVLSGYIINWNKAMELARKTHPGQVVHLSDCPMDSNKLLIGYDAGSLVMWDLKSKTAEMRFNTPESLRSVSWHQEGKQFMCSHGDGSLTVWNLKSPQKPQSILMPHAKLSKDGKPEPCRPITKLEWKSTSRSSDAYMVFSGGMPYDKAMRAPSITVIYGKSTTVLEMEHNVIDFITLCSTPWDSDFQDPFGIVVLLQNDLVVVDLTSPGYPCFENPYPMDIHESPVTACKYLADCPPELIPAFYSVGSKQKKTGFSEKTWPVKGGEWGTTTCSYPEIMITGHADGSLKFWDASAVTLQVLYKLKTAKLFDRHKCKNPDMDDDPFTIQHLYFCKDSRYLVISGQTHLIMFKFSKQENAVECPVMELSIVYEIFDEENSPEFEYPPTRPHLGSTSQQSGSMGSYSSNASEAGSPKETTTSVKAKGGPRKWSAGYQPELCCILQWSSGEPPPPITSLSLNSRYGLLAFGNECGIAIIDTTQKTCLLNMGTPDLYGSMDPYSRVPRSPRSKNTMSQPSSASQLSQNMVNDECKSPTNDQQYNPPMSPSQTSSGRTASPRRQHLKMTPSLEKISEAEREEHMRADMMQKCRTRFASEGQGRQSRKMPYEGHYARQVSVDSAKDALAELYEMEHNNNSDIKKGEGTATTNKQKGTTADSPFEFIPDNFEFPTSAGTDCSVGDNREPEDVDVEQTTGIMFHKIGSKTTSSQKHKSRNSIRYSDIKDDDDDDVDIKVTAPTPERADSLEDAENVNLHRKLTAATSLDTAKTKLNHQDFHRASHSEYTLSERSFQAKEGSGGQKTTDNVGELSSGQSTPEKGNVTPVREKPKRPPPPLTLKTNAENIDDLESPISPSSASVSHGHPQKEKDTFVRKLSRKVKSLKTPVSEHSELREPKEKLCKRTSHGHPKFDVIDLTNEDVPEKPPVKKLSYMAHLALDGSFSRSRSSSMSSLENINKEAIQCLTFADAYSRKTDSSTCPCLWVGTSLGSVLVINLQLPSDSDRKKDPVVVSPSGTIFRLKGGILAMSFLDCNGILVPAVTDQWAESNNSRMDQSKDGRKSNYSRQQSMQSIRSHGSPTSSTDIPADTQFAIICSEKHARVVSLPSQMCVYKHKITDTSLVTVADIITIRDSVSLACYVANGHLMTFSLPSLRPLLDVDYLPLTDISHMYKQPQTEAKVGFSLGEIEAGPKPPWESIFVAGHIHNEEDGNTYACKTSWEHDFLNRIAKTFSFSSNGHALYFCSPSEVQKITLASDVCDTLSEMLGDLFLPCDTPQAPKKTFLQNLFSGGNAQLDREELFGEASGKASIGTAKHIPGPSGLENANQRANLATSEIGRAKLAALERGEKLGDLSDKTEQMMAEAEEYKRLNHELMLKYKNKKWYQF